MYFSQTGFSVGGHVALGTLRPAPELIGLLALVDTRA